LIETTEESGRDENHSGKIIANPGKEPEALKYTFNGHKLNLMVRLWLRPRPIFPSP
jgi:hypothetical protein